MRSDKEFLSSAPIGKLLFRLAVPTVTAQLINMLYNVVDRIYIGHIPGDGSLALTGVGVCTPIIMMVSDQTKAVYMAEPIADLLAVTFTAILFSFQFKKALRVHEKEK